MVLTKERIQAVVNSSDRLNPSTETTANFTWSFNEKVIRISEILIKSVQIPFSFYAINSTNNFMLVNGTTVTIDNGNYTATTLIPEVTSKIDASAVGGTTTMTYSSQTLKFTIVHDSNIQITDNSSDTSPLATLLGYQTTSASATTIIADSVANLAGSNYICITSDILTAAIQHKTLYANDTLQSCLLPIPVNVNFGDIITLEPNLPIKLSYKIEIETTDIIDIKLVDEFNNTLDLNGLDWSMQIVFMTE